MFKYRTKAKPIEYFTKEDCPHKFVYWKDIQEPGWALSDDGYVLWVKEVRPIVEIRGKGSRTRYKVMFELGIRFKHGNSKYCWNDYLERKSSANSYAPRDFVEDIDRRFPYLKRLFASLVMQGKLNIRQEIGYRKYKKSEWKELAKIVEIWKTDPKGSIDGKHLFMIRVLYNHWRMRDMVQKEIDKIVEKFNVDAEKVMALLAEAEGIARSKADAKSLITVAREYRDIIGMKQPGQTRQPQLPGNTDTGSTLDHVLNGKVEDAEVIAQE